MNNMNTYTKYMKLLNLTIPLTEQKIKFAYRSFVKSNHPDLFKNEENKKLATEKFKIATKAYEYLIKYLKNIKFSNNTINSVDNAMYEHIPHEGKKAEEINSVENAFYEFIASMEAFNKLFKQWKETKILN